MVPNDRRFTPTHEWVMIDGDLATIGLTEYAQEQMGDIVFVELPQVGDAMDVEGRLAVIESVKAASDAFSPLAGVVEAVNESLEDAPEQINEEPWTAWIAKVRFTELNDNALLDAIAYEAVLQAEEAKK